MKLRNYQSKAVIEILKAFEEQHQGVMYVAMCGSGKTVIFSSVIDKLREADSQFKAVIITHRKELLEQASEKLEQFHISHGVIQASRNTNPDTYIQVASIQTLINRELTFVPSLLIFDEAHHIAASSYQEIIQRYPKAKRLLVTASPQRLDGKGFDDVVSRLIKGPKTEELIAGGFLVPASYRFPLPSIEKKEKKLDKAAKTLFISGNYTDEQLLFLLNQQEKRQELINLWHIHAYNKRTTVFCIDKKHCEELKADFLRCGVNSEIITCDTTINERERLLKKFESGDLKVLLTVKIFEEGWDLPNLEAVVLARPTRSLASYIQQCGRVLRTYPSKVEGIIIDTVWACTTHGHIEDERDWSLEGTKKQAVYIDEIIKQKGIGHLQLVKARYWNAFNSFKGLVSKTTGKPYKSFGLHQRTCTKLVSEHSYTEEEIIAALQTVPICLADRYEIAA